MKTLPKQAQSEIELAKASLENCQKQPARAAYWIQVALSHTTEANQWIVAKILKENYMKTQRGGGR